MPIGPQFISPTTRSRATAENTLATHHPEIVVFDPFINFNLGNINDPSEVRATVAELTRIVHKACPNAAIIIIHHARAGRVNAASAIDAYDAANFGLGAKALFNSARCYMNLIPGSSEDRNRLVLSCAKASNCPHFEPRGVFFDENTGLYELDEESIPLKDDITGSSPETTSIQLVVCRPNGK